MPWRASWKIMPNNNTPLNQQKLLNALGLCAKARKAILGTPMICDALRTGKPHIYLVVAASDNSENTAKRLSDRCTYYNTPLTLSQADGDTLAHAMGKASRVAAVAITDEHLYRLVEGALDSGMDK